MTVTAFDPNRDLILVKSRIWSRDRYRDLTLAVDTASAATVVSPDVIEALGYSPRDGIAATTVRSAVGAEHGYTLKVAQIVALGFVFRDFEVNVFDLATGHGLDGLLGLSLLQRFDYAVRSIAGTIAVRPAVADSLPI